jgi:hypothetical protein
MEENQKMANWVIPIELGNELGIISRPMMNPLKIAIQTFGCPCANTFGLRPQVLFHCAQGLRAENLMFSCAPLKSEWTRL